MIKFHHQQSILCSCFDLLKRVQFINGKALASVKAFCKQSLPSKGLSINNNFSFMGLRAKKIIANILKRIHSNFFVFEEKLEPCDY